MSISFNNWNEYADHIYNITNTTNNQDNINSLKNMNLYGNPIFSFFLYNHCSTWKAYTNFKKAAFVEVIKNAYINNYNSIIIIYDECNILDENIYSKLLELQNKDIVILNPNDINEDCIYLSKTAIDFIYNLHIKFKFFDWPSTLKTKINENFKIYKLTQPLFKHKIDYVVTYVNGEDTEWQKEYNKYKFEGLESFNKGNRWREWGIFKYHILGVLKYMPWINNIYIIVSNESQVEYWMTNLSDKIKIVYHKDIIPLQYLPTFNSRTIEIFMFNIQNLSEYYIYSNDDMYTVGNINPTDYFENGRIKNIYNDINKPTTNYLKVCKNNWDLVSKEFSEIYKILVGLSKVGKKLNHLPHPILKSSSIHVYNINKKEILNNISKFRKDFNYNQYIYSLYDYCTKNTNEIKINYKYYRLAEIDSKDFSDLNKQQIVCFNDNVVEYSEHINNKLHELFDVNFKFDSSLIREEPIYTTPLINNINYNTNIEDNLKVAVCAIAKNENLYIREWVEYYKNLGIDKIFLYDNNDINGEHFEDVINDYITSGFVEVINKRGIEKEIRDNNRKNLQDFCYIDCMKSHKNEFSWICYLDIDEFLYIVNSTLKHYLCRSCFNNVDTIILNWQNYGDSGNTYYENKPVQERFTIPAPNVKWLRSNYQCKSIVRCCNKEIDLNTDHILIHKFLYVDKKVADSNGNNISSIITNHKCALPYLLYNNAFVKHYVTKTIEEYLYRYVGRFNSNLSYKNKKLQIFGINETCKHFFKINEITPEKEKIIENYKTKKPNMILSNTYKNINEYYNDK